MSSGSAMEIDDLDDANTFAAPCPEGSVPLHQVCDNCRHFFDSWEAFNVIEVRPKASPDVCDKKFELCTIAQLLRSKQTCHFCALVLCQFGGRSFLGLTLLVSLDAGYHSGGRDGQPDYVPVYMKLQGELDHVIHFYIRGFNCELSKDAQSAQLTDQSHMRMRSMPQKKHNTYRVRAADNLEKSKDWLHACRTNHETCSTWCSNLATSGKRPTRIFELTATGAKVRCNTQSIQNFEYLALSHIRGSDPSQQLRLTTSRIEEFQIAVPWNELPDLFKETLRITRGIGFQYVWIDSLCIVQDSSSDWETQASMMSAVYSNAVCSIAFLIGPGNMHRISREDPRTLSPCVVRSASITKKGVYIVPSSKALPILMTHSYMSQEHWPLRGRAWTFQENLLSPRTILYGLETTM
jgi:hypothetical protein